MLTKICNKCLETKKINDFYNHEGGKYGVMAICRLCCNEVNTKWSQSNKEKVLQKNKKWYKNNRERVYQLNTEWQRKNIEKYLLMNAKRRSKKHNLEFNITLEDIIVPEFCPILGIKLESNIGKHILHCDNSPSLDRIDPNKGYIKGNVKVISTRANMIKNCGTAYEHKLIYEYILKGVSNE